ncbi:MAG: hypothetical protein GY847_41290 [Proteobacteria bacterium]|nr:hypothetical protein [Pseudomonadota bacterium]
MNSSRENPNTKTIPDPIPIDFGGELLTVSSSIALPPGARVRSQISIPTCKEPLALTGKILSVVPESSGRFRFVIRLHNLTREQSVALSQLLSK